MKVQLLTPFSTPEFTYHAGDVADFPLSRAKELIAGGYAVLVDAGVAVGPEVVEMETSEEPEGEVETTERSRKRR